MIREASSALGRRTQALAGAQTEHDLRIGLIGCGRLAERGYVPALAHARDWRLAAVADPVASRCEGVAPATPAYSSAAALLDDAEVDALVLATPTAEHLADASLAAETNVPSLVEKPPAPDLGAALALARLDPPPRIGFNRRFEPWLAALRRRAPIDAALELALRLQYPGDAWRSHVVKDDILLSVGPHLLDLARWLTGGEMTRVRAAALTSSAVELELELETARAQISVAKGRPFRDSVTVAEAGEVVARWTAHSILGRGRRFAWRLGTPSTLVRSLVSQLDVFAAAVRGEPAPTLATARDAVAVMAAIDAARRSAADGGRWQAVDAPT